MLTRAKLDQINNRPHAKKSRTFWPLVAAATVALALAAFMLLSPYVALVVLLAGSLALLLAYRKDREGGAVPLSYAALGPESAARFAQIRGACEGLASSERVWSVPKKPERPQKPGGLASIPEKESARVGLLETPGIEADVDVWGIEAGGQRALFFPEGLLLYREGRYRAVSYGSLEVSFANLRLGEEEGVPKDAEVVGQTRRHVREDGAPDGRRSYKSEIPVVLYGLLKVLGPSGLEVRLLASDRRAALFFARTFGAGGTEGGRSAAEPPPGEASPGENGSATANTARNSTEHGARRPESSPKPSPEELRAAEARTILGVGAKASMRDVTAAYRRMARLYHPDKVANLPEEDREAAEGRMKEINAAYSLLKRPTRDASRA